MEDDDLFRIDVDFDVSRWLMLPPPEIDADQWARTMAQAWAKDLGRLGERNWAQVFELVLQQATRQSYSETPEEVFLHVLTPPNAAPDVALALLTALQVDEPAAAVADDMAYGLASECIETPSRTTVEGAGGPVETLTCHFREDDGSVQTQLRVMRKISDEILAILTASDYDIGRVLLMRDDMVALAQQVTVEMKSTG